jgi:hypothetical protein
MSNEPKTPKSDPLLGRSTPAIINHNLKWRSDEEFKKIHRRSKAEAREIVKEFNQRAAAKEALLGYPKDVPAVQAEPERAHNADGTFTADDKSTPETNEAYKEDAQPVKVGDEVHGVKVAKIEQISDEQREKVNKAKEIFQSREDHPTQRTEAATDLEEMHHKTFKKKYDLTKDEYRAKNNLNSIV